MSGNDNPGREAEVRLANSAVGIVDVAVGFRPRLLIGKESVIRKRIGAVTTATLLALAVGSAGCCHPRVCYPQPGFAGVPEAAERSADYKLPLSEVDREELIEFMAARGNRNDLEANPPLPGELRAVVQSYGPLLDRLRESRPTLADFADGTAFCALFDPAYRPLRIHDARVGRDRGAYFDLGAKEARALIKGDFVFAFYLRRLVNVPGHPAHPGADCWELSPRDAASALEYSGLVVFHKNFAIPTVAR